MKKFALLFILLSVFQAFSQEKSPPPYEIMNLRFVLEGNPTPEDVGFNSQNSSWQLKYELLFLSDGKLLTEKSSYKPFKIEGQTNETSDQSQKRVKKSNKVFDKAWKKLGTSVIKGKIPRAQLSNESNREITIPVALTPEIKEILAKATDTWDNPIFLLKVSGKVSLLTKDKLKFKGKFGFSWQCPTKFIEGTTRQLWMMNTCGGSEEIVRENNQLRFGFNSKIQ